MPLHLAPESVQDSVVLGFEPGTGVSVAAMTPELAATKSVIVMDYDDWTRVMITTNHGLDAQYPELQQSYVQWEGTEGLIRAQMGTNLDYPKGRGDTLEFYPRAPGSAGQTWLVGRAVYPKAKPRRKSHASSKSSPG